MTVPIRGVPERGQFPDVGFVADVDEEPDVFQSCASTGLVMIRVCESRRAWVLLGVSRAPDGVASNGLHNFSSVLRTLGPQSATRHEASALSADGLI